VIWEKLGLLLKPKENIQWLSTCAGPTFALPVGNNMIELYVAGRDDNNRSRIGRAMLDIEKCQITNIDKEAVFDLGELGTFDFNGTSYPWLVQSDGDLYLYYTGWTIGYHVGFINDLGLAIMEKGSSNFKKVSRATIFPRTNAEPFGTGSVCVIKENNAWKMWYTTFKSWGDETSPGKHFYHIKYAESQDGINWSRPNKVAIDFIKENGEYVTGKPCIIKHKGWYIMWFSYRGHSYRIGFAVSKNGVDWKRIDSQVGIDISDVGFDNEMICYGHVFPYKDFLYMVYNGNGYGKSGLGLARMPISDLDTFLEVLN
jgi:hypothetical protein